MSDSNEHNNEQGQPQSGGYEAFQMESFDDAGGSSTGQGDGYIFEALYNSGGRAAGSFDYMISNCVECAEEIVAKAEEIISEAKKKADSIERDAYEKGFAQGEKDGLEIGGKRVDKILEKIEQVLQEVVKYKETFMVKCEKEALDLIRRIAEKVVHGLARVDHEIVRKTIFEAFRLVADCSEVTVRISQEDMDYVKELRPEFFDRINGLKSITMESDPSITPGGCYLETAFGDVDGRLETQLEKIAEAMKNSFKQGIKEGIDSQL
ncbi:MAG: hypothetical protein BBJ60_09870 [Desulfobacterales bacterium S7086C20]|nr:MAG: hypothetical protein BBJ60_09870 [Desulfobacterales bacterium S7086C20]